MFHYCGSVSCHVRALECLNIESRGKALAPKKPRAEGAGPPQAKAKGIPEIKAKAKAKAPVEEEEEEVEEAEDEETPEPPKKASKSKPPVSRKTGKTSA